MLKRIKKIIQRDERGITGLETAIILIAFVVVASVFAYTVLSAGIFSSQKSQEAVYAGLEETRASMSLRGSVLGYCENATSGEQVFNDTLVRVDFTLTNTLEGQAIDLTPAFQRYGGTGGLTVSNSTNVCIVTFADANQYIGDCVWTLAWSGKNDSDNLLESEEKAVLSVYMCNYTQSGNYSIDVSALGNYYNSQANCTDIYDKVIWEIRPETGAALVIERTLPARLDTIIDLN